MKLQHQLQLETQEPIMEARIRKRFGDEQSTLLDQFERLSFEAHLNKAMLQRSLSEPGLPRSRFITTVAPSIPMVTQVNQGKRPSGSRFYKVLKKLLKPILGRKSGTRKQVQDDKNPLSWKHFSRSLRF
ncbi:hypothetical protein Lal_00021189 [Lupinus albus]|uniref:Uncharacterized protein n=1 Tax=Lupinus albus TaxID=3870 RepID=A0A6A5MZV5_LUPAL|nr:hypothetical protein Lalb_Chr07g0190371 [Lupinus albus]KAF1876630.1 hypothetical protein Lal_00021189 [Lupinus albus]